MTSSCALHLEHEIALVVEVVERRTLAFLRDEFGFSPRKIEHWLQQKERVLRDITAIVGVGSKAGLYIAFSYDDSLIRALATLYTAGISVSPEDKDLYVRETASEVVNVIVGNITADLAKRGELITLSPPVLVMGARTICGQRETTVAALSLRFQEGTLDVEFVGPKILFDEQLNYRGKVS